MSIQEQPAKIRIAWAFTGAGHHLLESYGFLKTLSQVPRIELSLFFSRAAYEVTRMYGIRDQLMELASSPRIDHVYLEQDHIHSFPICGKFNLDHYRYLVVSPTTGNTVAKIVHGIADSLVSSIVAMAMKGPPRVLLVPSDYEVGELTTSLPMTVNMRKCEECETLFQDGVCAGSNVCPYGAIMVRKGHVFLDLRRCTGCKSCLKACPRGAFQFGKKIQITIRDIDAQNTQKLQEMEGIEVFPTPKIVYEVITRDLDLGIINNKGR